ncbi:glycosyltransferase family 4 protein [Pseudothermotoga thermarum]|uniref:Glycosyl transferase group 1 n=1 Tax=Pseudothermotoga thermarum DSM 5069 TaxID=688269 RepID=F7YVK4_9THEM|nr:glycosyltransferase family 4 protein [Pseudothermotoga thermarum]AEH51659.1 glycosyl transferase group 1 [Pseudothermotoga thermarum DSM 5069]
MDKIRRIDLVSADAPVEPIIGGKHAHIKILENRLGQIGISINRIYYHNTFLERVISRLIRAFFNYTKYGKHIINNQIKFFSKQICSGEITHCHDVTSTFVDSNNIILTVHGYLANEFFDYARLDKSKYKDLYNWLTEIEQRGYTKAKKIIAVDTRIANYIIEKFKVPKEKVVVMYNFIDENLFKPVNYQEKEALRKKYKIPKDAFVVLVPRRFVPKNGVIYAAEAFAKIKDNSFFFIFAGRGALKKEILKIMRENDNYAIIENVGYGKVQELYQLSDVILVPSITSTDVEEATSLSALEGMACEKIVVATNVGGLKEIVKHLDTGVVISQKSSKDIIDAIIYCKENYETLFHVRSNARKYVLKNHSSEVYVAKLLEVYSSVI